MYIKYLAQYLELSKHLMEGNCHNNQEHLHHHHYHHFYYYLGGVLIEKNEITWFTKTFLLFGKGQHQCICEQILY